MNTIKKLKENIVGAVLNAAGVEGEYQNKKSMLQGWLTKRATKSAKNWDLRYFMLFDNALVYYADSDSLYPRGEMKFNEDFFVCDSFLIPYGFQISDLTTTYYLQADTMGEKLFWMHFVLIDLDDELLDEHKLENNFQKSVLLMLQKNLQIRLK